MLPGVALTIPSPMLAVNWIDARPQSGPLWIQPKINGIRAMAARLPGLGLRFITRGGCVLEGLQPIAQALASLLPIGAVWDGELALPSGKAAPEEFGQLSGDLRAGRDCGAVFWVFDAPGPEGYASRTWPIWHLRKSDCVKTIWPHTRRASTPAQATQIAAEWISAGWEGAIVRLPQSGYVAGRSKGLLKIKENYA